MPLFTVLKKITFKIGAKNEDANKLNYNQK
jgi:hypothetical protein